MPSRDSHLFIASRLLLLLPKWSTKTFSCFQSAPILRKPDLADQKLSNGKNSSACLRCLDLSQSACLTTSKCLMFNVWTLSIRMPQTFGHCLLALTWLPAFISISPTSEEVVWYLPMSLDVSQATDIWSESTLSNKIPATLINCTGGRATKSQPEFLGGCMPPHTYVVPPLRRRGGVGKGIGRQSRSTPLFPWNNGFQKSALLVPSLSKSFPN